MVRRVLLALALLCTPLAALSLTGTQRRQLRAIAGRREAAKTLHRMNVAEPARSAAELDTVLRAAELVRCKFPVLHKREVSPLAEELAALVDPPAEVPHGVLDTSTNFSLDDLLHRVPGCYSVFSPRHTLRGELCSVRRALESA